MSRQIFNPLVKEGFQQLGTGHEPFLDEYSLFPVQAQQSFQQPVTAGMLTEKVMSATANSNCAFPFYFQQDVLLKKYNFYKISDVLSEDIYYRLCVYEYDSVIDSQNTRFRLAFQEASSHYIEEGDLGGYTNTLSTPVTLVAGKVYIACLLPDSGYSVWAQSVVHNGTTNLPIPSNKFLGVQLLNAPNNCFQIGVSFSGVVTGNVAPATLDCHHILNTEVGFEYLRMTLQNA